MLVWHDTVFLVLLFSRRNFVSFGDVGVEMLTKSRVFVINIGSTVHLECAFKYSNFNFFDNPILWRKTQLDEQSQINMMGNLLDPFDSSGRFKVTFGKQSKVFTLALFISHVIFEDSGNYTCDVNGPHNKLLNSVTHYIFIRAVEIIDLSLTSSDRDEIDHAEERRPRHSLVFVENTPTTLTCRATGGYPPPDLTMHIDRTDVTDEFSLHHETSLDGAKSLRRLIFTTWRRKGDALLRRDDEGRRITCVATVPGLQSNSTSAIVEVHHAPSITCDKTLASLGERNVHLKCNITSRPPVHLLHWIIDSNGTRLFEGDFINGHWTQITIQSGGRVESKLYILQVKAEHFGKYKMVAGNSIGNGSEEVVLAQRMHSLNKETISGASKTKMLLRDQAASGKNLHVGDLKLTRKVGSVASWIHFDVFSVVVLLALVVH